jgi:hypothetical protein
MRFLLISSIILLVVGIWSVSSGVEDNNSVVPSGFLCPGCYERAKSILEKAWTLSDPIVSSYGVLVYNILKFDVPKAQVFIFVYNLFGYKVYNCYFYFCRRCANSYKPV